MYEDVIFNLKCRENAWVKKLLIIICLVYAAAANAEVRNFEAKGNLQSRHPLACVAISGLSNQNTPADMFEGIDKCIQISNYQNASVLYLAALAFGRFDSERVEDKTAHQAIFALRTNHFGGLSKDKLTKLQVAINKAIKNRGAICQALINLGKPDYYPRYMIQHGMGAFLGNKSKNGLVANFDPARAWDDVLKNYMKCGK